MSLFEKTAPVLERTPEGIRFQVNGVTPETQPLAVEAAEGLFQRQVGKDVLAFSHAGRTPFVVGPDRLSLDGGRVHPLLEAVHLAFSRHYPLILTPDIIWLTIAQGFAQHVNNNPEILRDRFVSHSKKKQLAVITDDLSEPAHWRAAVEGWAKLIGSQVKEGAASLLVCDFSTTTPDARTASQVVLMEAFQQYFDYVLWCICGIPHITLRGTVDDWREIQSRVQQLEQYDLSWCTQPLSTVCEGLVRTAEGEPPLLFWQSMYKPEKAYGGDVITGWIADLFPYLTVEPTGRAERRNPLLNTPLEQRNADSGWRMDAFPVGLSRVPFRLEVTKLDGAYSCQLIAGLVGIHQHTESLALEPEIGWGILESDDLGDSLERVAADSRHRLNPRLTEEREQSLRANGYCEMPAELVKFYDVADGGTLFADSTAPVSFRRVADLRVHTLSDHATTVLDSAKEWRTDSGSEVQECRTYDAMIAVGDLPDRRVLGIVRTAFYRRKDDYVSDRITCLTGFVVAELQEAIPIPDTSPLALARNEPPVAEIKIVAGSLNGFIERLLDEDGRYYFDAADFTPPGTDISV